MNFFLPFPIAPLSQNIRYSDRIMMIGSCFSAGIGERLASYKFKVLQNPTGIIYHPHMISEAVERCIENRKFEEAELFENNGLFHCWSHHSEFSGTDKASTLGKMNDQLECAHEFLKTCDYLILTPATAYGYFLVQDQKMVGNCHKMPGHLFDKRLTDSNSIIENLKDTIDKVRSFQPEIKIIFTISPVKHYRDGIVENNISKSHVIAAVHQVTAESSGVYYFPSYEILIDELRDYRFFKNDFAHPNETAVSYIFQRFVDFAFDENTKTLMNRVGEIITASQHRMHFPHSEKSKGFANQQLKKISNLKAEFSFLDFEKEIEHFKNI